MAYRSNSGIKKEILRIRLLHIDRIPDSWVCDISFVAWTCLRYKAGDYDCYFLLRIVTYAGSYATIKI
jgi:hypothetical protein